jgi:hypothetical protein
VRGVDPGVENGDADALAGNAEIVPGRVGANKGVWLRHEKRELPVSVNLADASEAGDGVDLGGRGEEADRVQLAKDDRSGAEVLNPARQFNAAGDGRIEIHHRLHLVGWSECRQLCLERWINENAGGESRRLQAKAEAGDEQQGE